MTTRSEQLSARFTVPFPSFGKFPWEAQIDILQAWSNRAIDSAEQLISLNLRASRTSVEQATGTFKQLLDATNPRDVIAAGSRAQGQWHYLFDYGRELLVIASSAASAAPAQAWSTQPALRVLPTPLQVAHTANVPATAPQAVEQASIAIADVTTVTTEIAAAAADTGAALAEAGLHAAGQAVTRTASAAESATDAAADATEAATEAAPKVATEAAVETTEAAADIVDNGAAAAYEAADAAQQAGAQVAAQVTNAAEHAQTEAEQQLDAAIETAIADDVPPAKATPLAQALNEVAPKPASVEHPIASTIALEAHDHVELPHVTPVDAEPPLHVPPPPPAKERRSRSRK